MASAWEALADSAARTATAGAERGAKRGRDGPRNGSTAWGGTGGDPATGRPATPSAPRNPSIEARGRAPASSSWREPSNPLIQGAAGTTQSGFCSFFAQDAA